MIYIDTQSDLESTCNLLNRETVITFDCEFIRETTFVPVLCLVQISTRDNIYIIDPLNLELEPLFVILSNENILKIMHSSTQDIDVFYKNFSLIPKPIFDTQIAASFLGYGDSISYAKLVKQITKEVLCKDSKLTNWQMRPLKESQLNYAMSDVKYLFQIYDDLLKKLKEKERVDWFEAEVQDLYNIDNYYVDPDESWKRVKGSGIKPFFINYLKAFSKLREEIAVRTNRPRRFVMKDEVLIQLSNLQPQSQEDILHDRILKKTLSKDLIRKLVEVSLSVDKNSEELKIPKHKKLSGNKELICDILKLFLKYTAKKYDIAAKYIARTEELEKFIQGKLDDIRFLSGWRYEIFGQDVQRIEAGEVVPRIINHKLVFHQEKML